MTTAGFLSELSGGLEHTRMYLSCQPITTRPNAKGLLLKLAFGYFRGVGALFFLLEHPITNIQSAHCRRLGWPATNSACISANTAACNFGYPEEKLGLELEQECRGPNVGFDVFAAMGLDPTEHLYVYSELTVEDP